MSFVERIFQPLDPLEFRDAIIGLHAEMEGRDDAPSGIEVATFYFLSRWEGHPDQMDLATRASLRLVALAKMVGQRGLDDLVRPTSDGGVKEVHHAVIEAAAVCPFDEDGSFRRDDLIREAASRASHIDAVIALLGDAESS